jgi:hypothetical protein
LTAAYRPFGLGAANGFQPWHQNSKPVDLRILSPIRSRGLLNSRDGRVVASAARRR